ncbi:MAG TPA: peptide chain release factor 1, partial [Acetobacteraceae bacterium]|nr:peptide chain release factor 1 [Acetobacteraceae bacterium]
MNLAEKLDRIVSRAEELRDLLSSGVSGEAFVAASRELSELAPIEERINELRAAEKARGEAEAL